MSASGPEIASEGSVPRRSRSEAAEDWVGDLDECGMGGGGPAAELGKTSSMEMSGRPLSPSTQSEKNQERLTPVPGFDPNAEEGRSLLPLGQGRRRVRAWMSVEPRLVREVSRRFPDLSRAEAAGGIGGRMNRLGEPRKARGRRPGREASRRRRQPWFGSRSARWRGRAAGRR